MSFKGNNPLELIQYLQIDEMRHSGLGDSITLSEVQDAIKSMHCGQSSGPSSCTVEFYEKVSNLISPILHILFGRSPSSISVRHLFLFCSRKTKTPLFCSSFRPISLLNVDFKIFFQVLTNRLQTVVPDLISLDQTGFILERHSFFNVQ